MLYFNYKQQVFISYQFVWLCVQRSWIKPDRWASDNSSVSPGGWTTSSSHQGIFLSCHDLILTRLPLSKCWSAIWRGKSQNDGPSSQPLRFPAEQAWQMFEILNRSIPICTERALTQWLEIQSFIIPLPQTSWRTIQAKSQCLAELICYIGCIMLL